MNEALLEMMRPVNWPLFALVSARVAGLMMMAPLWSLRAIPALVRGSMAVVLTLMLLPGASAASLPASGAVPLLALIGDFLVGVAIGLTAAVFMHGLTVAAEVVSLQMGLSLGVAFGGMSDVGTPGIGQFYGQMALAIFAALGGHVLLIVAVSHSLHELPPGATMAYTDGAVALLAITGTVFSSAIRVAAPVMVALLVTNLALAVLNRAVPQLNTMMVAVPITVAVGLMAMGATLSLLANEMTRWVAGLDEGIARLIATLQVVPVGGP